MSSLPGKHYRRARYSLLKENVQFAKSIGAPKRSIVQLQYLTEKFSLSINLGDLLLLGSGWYVTHAGLIRLALRKRCQGITVRLISELSDPASARFAFQATVYPHRGARGFGGIGDADPSNVPPKLRGAEVRIAETRAVNRALRKAYGIGICSFEELDSLRFLEGGEENSKLNSLAPNCNGGPKLRDQLCQLIRKHQLDPGLVKAYAVDFCAVKVLREATRNQIEKFVLHLGEFAEKDRDALLCQLNSYPSEQGGVQ